MSAEPKDTMGTVTYQVSDGSTFPRRVTLADLSPEQRDRVCNGCGPRSWKRRTVVTPHCRDCCDAHDLAYWLGGPSVADRKAADYALYDCMRREARTLWIGARLLALVEAWLFYRAVRRDGHDHFRWGTMRTMDDVNRLTRPPLPPIGGTGRSP